MQTYINRLHIRIVHYFGLLCNVTEVRSIFAKTIVDASNVLCCIDAIANTKNAKLKLEEYVECANSQYNIWQYLLFGALPVVSK